MQGSGSISAQITHYYTAATDALCEIGKAYTDLGKLADAQRVFQTALVLMDMSEAQPPQRLKLLLQYGKMLIVAQTMNSTAGEQVLSTLEQARQIAETTQDIRSMADALSLLGQAHYFSTIVNNNILDNAQGKYQEAFAYQRQALELRETLQDTRGLSESHFCLGNIYERWQQLDAAVEHYTRARQLAEQYGHRDERTEPTRHLALLALQQGDLDQALKDGLQALSFREEAQFKPFLPLDHVLLSNIYLARGSMDQALFHAQKASELATEIGFRGALVFSLLSLGDIQVAQGEKARARASYEKALALAQESQSPLLLTMANASLKRAGFTTER